MSNEWLNDARKIPGEAMGYIRKLAVRAVVEKGYGAELVADLLGVARSSLYEWLRSHREGGYDALDTREPPGSPPLITREMERWLCRLIDWSTPADHGYESPLWKCEILADMLRREFGVKVQPGTVGIRLKKLGKSYQKPTWQAAERDEAEIDFFLNEKYPRIERLAERLGADIGFEDEAKVEGQAHAGRTWGTAGRTPVVRASARHTKVNVLGFVTPQGCMDYELTAGRVDSETFIAFLEEKALAGRTRPLILLVDRAKFHASRAFRRWVRANRQRIRVFFLPKYAPEYNPAEQLWEEIKDNRLGRVSISTQAELVERTRAALEAVRGKIERIMSFFHTPDTEYAS